MVGFPQDNRGQRSPHLAVYIAIAFPLAFTQRKCTRGDAFIPHPFESEQATMATKAVVGVDTNGAATTSRSLLQDGARFR